MKLVRELRGGRFSLLDPSLGREGLEELARLSEERAAKSREKLERMMQYGQSAACRWRLLHDYFGEEMEAEQCGTCDNCLRPPDEQLSAARSDTNEESDRGIPDASRDGVGSVTQLPATRAHQNPEVGLSVGDIVEHAQFGTGRVQSVEGDKVSIKFGRGRARVFKEEFISAYKL